MSSQISRVGDHWPALPRRVPCGLPALLALLAAQSACTTPLPSVGDLALGDGASAVDGGGSVADAATLAVPALPPSNDPAFKFSGLRTWYLVGSSASAGDDRLKLSAVAPAGTTHMDAWLDGRYLSGLRAVTPMPAPAGPAPQAGFALDADLTVVGAGVHQLVLSANRGQTATAVFSIKRSHPLYAVVTNDWDNSDNADAMLERQERLHARHSELKLTHFVGPYTFTDRAVTEARRQTLVSWLLKLRSQLGDEIGMHIHPYCNFVTTTRVPCRTSPSFAYASGDATGYTVVLSAYSQSEQLTLLLAGNELFKAHGLGRATSFRAGGWTADLSTVNSLVEAGFVADGSGCNWSRMEEWKDRPGATLYAWNKEHWSTIKDTSQPYFPSRSSILRSGENWIHLLEVPDNGQLVDYVTAQEMIDIWRANWNGEPLTSPTVYSIGYHPPNFSEAFFTRIDQALSNVDSYLYSADKGPVVYLTMSPLSRIFAPPI